MYSVWSRVALRTEYSVQSTVIRTPYHATKRRVTEHINKNSYVPLTSLRPAEDNELRAIDQETQLYFSTPGG